MAGQKKEILGLQMDKNLSSLNVSILLLEKIQIILVLCQNFNIHEGYLGIRKKKIQSRVINVFLL